VTFNLEAVAVNLETIPLAEVISFRVDHKAEFRA